MSSVDPSDPASSSILRIQGNPAPGIVRIDYSAGDRSPGAEILLMNASGQQIAREVIGGLDGQVTISIPVQGIYYAVLLDGNRVLDVKQVIGL